MNGQWVRQEDGLGCMSWILIHKILHEKRGQLRMENLLLWKLLISRLVIAVNKLYFHYKYPAITIRDGICSTS